MAHRGYFPLELLSTYATPESNLSEHPSPGCIPGFELATGSLGHGLSVGIGMALAAHIKKDRYRTYVLLSDGECNEGTVWEAALSAKAFNLQNIVAIVDYNKWQATGKSDEVLALHPLSDKWSSFGWNVQEIDGHNIGAIIDALERTTKAEQPSIIIAHTVKGKGITFILT
jgi:transketolase